MATSVPVRATRRSGNYSIDYLLTRPHLADRVADVRDPRHARRASSRPVTPSRSRALRRACRPSCPTSGSSRDRADPQDHRLQRLQQPHRLRHRRLADVGARRLCLPAVQHRHQRHRATAATATWPTSPTALGQDADAATLHGDRPTGFATAINDAPVGLRQGRVPRRAERRRYPDRPLARSTPASSRTAFGVPDDDRAPRAADYIGTRGMACSVYCAAFLHRGPVRRRPRGRWRYDLLHQHRHCAAG